MEIFSENLSVKQRAKEQDINNPSKDWAQAVEDLYGSVQGEQVAGKIQCNVSRWQLIIWAASLLLLTTGICEHVFTVEKRISQIYNIL